MWGGGGEWGGGGWMQDVGGGQGFYGYSTPANHSNTLGIMVNL